MIEAQHEMTPAQMMALLDAAIRSPHALSYLDAVASTFSFIGRDTDAKTAGLLGCLYAEGEIEILTSLRSAWKRGQTRSPASVSR